MTVCGDLLDSPLERRLVQAAAFALESHRDNVGFFYGAMLDDSAGLLEGTGKRMRHVKLKPGDPMDAAAPLNDLINAAYLDIRKRGWPNDYGSR